MNNRIKIISIPILILAIVQLIHFGSPRFIFERDLNLICEAYSMPLSKSINPAQQAYLRAKHLEENCLWTKDALNINMVLHNVDPADRRAILEKSAALAGIKGWTCKGFIID